MDDPSGSAQPEGPKLDQPPAPVQLNHLIRPITVADALAAMRAREVLEGVPPIDENDEQLINRHNFRESPLVRAFPRQHLPEFLTIMGVPVQEQQDFFAEIDRNPPQILGPVPAGRPGAFAPVPTGIPLIFNQVAALPLDDPLAQNFAALLQRRNNIVAEINRRQGPGPPPAPARTFAAGQATYSRLMNACLATYPQAPQPAPTQPPQEGIPVITLEDSDTEEAVERDIYEPLSPEVPEVEEPAADAAPPPVQVAEARRPFVLPARLQLAPMPDWLRQPPPGGYFADPLLHLAHRAANIQQAPPNEGDNLQRFEQLFKRIMEQERAEVRDDLNYQHLERQQMQRDAQREAFIEDNLNDVRLRNERERNARNAALEAMRVQNEEMARYFAARVRSLQQQANHPQHRRDLFDLTAPIPKNAPRVTSRGKCCICYDPTVTDPVGCGVCRNHLGCRRCVQRWYLAQIEDEIETPFCPLYRCEWHRGFQVETMTDMDAARAAEQRRRDEAEIVDDDQVPGPSNCRKRGPSEHDDEDEERKRRL